MRSDTRPLTIAISALGGQGGGVLSGWIVATAEANGFLAQYTSVPGVAQRTGATVYCIELFPRSEAEKGGQEPVLALMPMPGDVDIVIAAELMEAGRAITRGFVTPDTTTLIASTHREYAISEKSAMGDNIADADTVIAAARERAKRLVAFDMKAQAEMAGSVISSALFGALAGSGALPFGRAAYEDTIRRSRHMVEANLDAFAVAYEQAQASDAEPAKARSPARPALAAGLPKAKTPKGQALLDRIAADHPAKAHDTLVEGVKRCADYQDLRYASDYLDRLGPIAAIGDAALLDDTARHLALWMTYEDTIRVADLKTRASRFARSEAEVQARPGQIVYLTEFMHPRVSELADTLPAPIGRRLMASARAQRLLGRILSKGRTVQTAKLSGFLLLYSLAALRPLRRITLRHGREMGEIGRWLGRITRIAEEDKDLAGEVARCQRLIKGYGDTHARGLANFSRLMATADRLRGRQDAAKTMASLREAALADDAGKTLAAKLAEERLDGAT